MTRSMIAILDLGSTQNARIAREVRALGVYSEIFAHDTDPAALKQVQGLAGIIVNGGENNIVDGEKIDVRPGVYELGLPVLTVAHEGAHPSDLPAWPDDSKPMLDKFIASTGCEPWRCSARNTRIWGRRLCRSWRASPTPAASPQTRWRRSMPLSMTA